MSRDGRAHFLSAGHASPDHRPASQPLGGGSAAQGATWHDRVTAVVSIAGRGTWFRTPGRHGRRKVREYSDLPPFGDLRGTLPTRSFFGPVHRVEVAIHEEHFYVTVLVPSCFQEFAGLLSWVNIWCSFNQDNPSCTKGVLFADGPVDSSGWRLSGWVDIYLEEADSQAGHSWAPGPSIETAQFQSAALEPAPVPHAGAEAVGSVRPGDNTSTHNTSTFGW